MVYSAREVYLRPSRRLWSRPEPSRASVAVTQRGRRKALAPVCPGGKTGAYGPVVAARQAARSAVKTLAIDDGSAGGGARVELDLDARSARPVFATLSRRP